MTLTLAALLLNLLLLLLPLLTSAGFDAISGTHCPPVAVVGAVVAGVLAVAVVVVAIALFLYLLESENVISATCQTSAALKTVSLLAFASSHLIT